MPNYIAIKTLSLMQDRIVNNVCPVSFYGTLSPVRDSTAEKFDNCKQELLPEKKL